MAALRAWWQRVRGWFRPLSLGQQGERAAARYLRRRRMRVVARGSRSRLGEIDLVALDGRTIVFVEVKTRRGEQAGAPAEAVDEAKQARLTRAALGYLQRHGLLEYAARFDVVAVTWPARGRPAIEHIRGAFSARGSDGMFG